MRRERALFVAALALGGALCALANVLAALRRAIFRHRS